MIGSPPQVKAMDFGHLEGVPHPPSFYDHLWLKTTYVRHGMILQVFGKNEVISHTLLEINMSHLRRRKIIFKIALVRDMLVPWRVTPHNLPINGHIIGFFLTLLLAGPHHPIGGSNIPETRRLLLHEGSKGCVDDGLQFLRWW